MFKKVLTIFVLAIIISVFLISANEQEFDQTLWQNQPTKRYKMSKDIIESELLLGKSEEAIIRLLGTPETSNLDGKPHLIYPLGKAPSFFESNEPYLVVLFEEGVANKVIYSDE